MTVSQKAKSIIVEICSLLYIILFIYAALNKFLDFENFQVQLAQSPLLSSFAEPISYIVPISEIIIALLLCVGRFRLPALFAGYMLMVMFSAYIFIMLHYSPFVPCSCGGILEKLSWNQHLAFNLIYVFIAAAGILLIRDEAIRSRNLSTQKSRYFGLAVASFIGVSTVVVLFLLSEDMIRHRNNFTRRFPHHPAGLRHEHNLKSSAYYIAGADDDKVYLGNHNNPLSVHIADSSFQIQREYDISLKSDHRQYRSLRLNVKGRHFFISDGRESFIFRGSITNWQGNIAAEKMAYFNAIVPVDSTSFVIRSVSSESNENVLGIINVSEQPSVSLHPILEKQIDGIFDTAGTLVYNEQLGKVIYTYTYRNEFVIANQTLQHVVSGNTIDTTSKARIKVAYVESEKGRKLNSLSWKVNIKTATYGKYLFVNSALIGQFEPRDMWDEASIIDVYDITDQSYAFSFYVYNKKGKKMRDFIVTKDRLYALVGDYIMVYKLEDDFYKQP